uniref:Uncharacterized protein n=1 Tax=Arcella intermedia TaxID=1963864 RepID=A0A6B2LX21_9EUKA
MLKLVNRDEDEVIIEYIYILCPISYIPSIKTLIEE